MLYIIIYVFNYLPAPPPCKCGPDTIGRTMVIHLTLINYWVQYEFIDAFICIFWFLFLLHFEWVLTRRISSSTIQILIQFKIKRKSGCNNVNMCLERGLICSLFFDLQCYFSQSKCDNLLWWDSFYPYSFITLQLLSELFPP